MAIVAVLAYHAVVLGRAGAASFDCAKATSDYDKLICTTPELSAADERMVAAYDQARAKVSAEGKRLFRDGQRSWIKNVRDDCQLDQQCIGWAYDRRIKQLADAVTTIGPYRFQAIDSFAVEKIAGIRGADQKPVRDFEGPGLFKVVSSYPRIDLPDTPETSRWNGLVRAYIASFISQEQRDLEATQHEPADFDMGAALKNITEFTVECQIAYAAKDVISLSIFREFFASGAAHPDHGSVGYTVLLPSGKILDAARLFNRRRNWNEFLAGQVFENLAKDARDEGWDLGAHSAADLIKDVADNKHWTISPDGLTVFFSPYEVANYASGFHEVTIDWQTLKPYLASPPPFPIPPR